ncbi:hypothetical protein [Geodermatophilus sp. DSM 44513]|uniref:hypothetical protein n=1 Tax=Geodermatophilus sp. DSM 44513 TaxID=1528104 RepID=UPI001411FAA9|nr:hypothetical protein [Geodermatophilus sp. DSM 44513]WNV74144.1 hypothetical protein RTG05_14225 [Geodermatophilus sp. DSM 44513]
MTTPSAEGPDRSPVTPHDVSSSTPRQVDEPARLVAPESRRHETEGRSIDPESPLIPSGRHTRGRPWLLGALGIGACTTLAGAVLAVVDTDPETPREAVEAYIDEMIDGDAARTWDLMCQKDQEAEGPRERFLQETAADQEAVSAEDDLWHITVGGTRFDERAGATRVQLLVWADTELQYTDEVHVVREAGRLRVCTISGMGF